MEGNSLKAEEIVYQCVKCGKQAPLSEWQRIDVPGQFKCPNCGYKVAKKIRGPLAKRLSTK
jgi:DNA-directed RNA polymerase subunit RPC12/RpoP